MCTAATTQLISYMQGISPLSLLPLCDRREDKKWGRIARKSDLQITPWELGNNADNRVGKLVRCSAGKHHKWDSHLIEICSVCSNNGGMAGIVDLSQVKISHHALRCEVICLLPEVAS